MKVTFEIDKDNLSTILYLASTYDHINIKTSEIEDFADSHADDTLEIDLSKIVNDMETKKQLQLSIALIALQQLAIIK